MAEGEGPVEAGREEANASADQEVDGWPVLSDLELDVCLSESTLPGVNLPGPDAGEV